MTFCRSRHGVQCTKQETIFLKLLLGNRKIKNQNPKSRFQKGRLGEGRENGNLTIDILPC
jgi:hypothetical protein